MSFEINIGNSFINATEGFVNLDEHAGIYVAIKSYLIGSKLTKSCREKEIVSVERLLKD